MLALSLMLGWRHVALVYGAVFLAGTAETLVDNAALRVPPRLVPREPLERANGRLFATQWVINTLVGPPFGAFLFAAAASVAFFTSAGAFALAGLAAFLLPQLLPTAAERGHEHGTVAGVGRSIAGGWSHFWHHDLLRLAEFLAAVASSLNQIVVSTLRQAAVPDALLGRVTAAYRLIVLGVVPIGALAGGLVGRAWGIRAPFVAAAVGLTLAALVFASRVTTKALRDAEVVVGQVAPQPADGSTS